MLYSLLAKIYAFYSCLKKKLLNEKFGEYAEKSKQNQKSYKIQNPKKKRKKKVLINLICIYYIIFPVLRIYSLHK